MLEMPKGTAFLKGDYWHIPMVSQAEAKKSTKKKTHSVGRKGHMQRVTGKIRGKWKTISWRIPKDDALLDFNYLFAKDPREQKKLEKIEDKLGRMIKIRKRDALREALSPRMKSEDWYVIAEKGLFTELLRYDLSNAIKRIKTRKKTG